MKWLAAEDAPQFWSEVAYLQLVSVSVKIIAGFDDFTQRPIGSVAAAFQPFALGFRRKVAAAILAAVEGGILPPGLSRPGFRRFASVSPHPHLREPHSAGQDAPALRQAGGPSLLWLWLCRAASGLNLGAFWV